MSRNPNRQKIKGLPAHGSDCKKPMTSHPSHLGRKHKACVPKDTLRRACSCVITAGKP